MTIHNIPNITVTAAAGVTDQADVGTKRFRPAFAVEGASTAQIAGAYDIQTELFAPIGPAVDLFALLDAAGLVAKLERGDVDPDAFGWVPVAKIATPDVDALPEIAEEASK